MTDREILIQRTLFVGIGAFIITVAGVVGAIGGHESVFRVFLAGMGWLLGMTGIFAPPDQLFSPHVLIERELANQNKDKCE